MSKILVIGSSNIDLIARVARLPLPGETVGQARFMQVNGGKGANQAVAAARLGGDVAFITCLGNDQHAAQLREQFVCDGINPEGILTTDSAPTGTALIFVSEDAENSIAVAPGANDRLARADIDTLGHLIAQAEYVLLQLEIPMDIVQYAIDKARQAGAKVVLNPAPAMPLSDELLRKLYMITPNLTECEMLTGIRIESAEDAVKAADLLLAKGVEYVVITLGARGALLRSASLCEFVPARRVKAVDTTAAGDVFNGGVLVALAEGRPLTEVVRFAAAGASIAVTRLGAQPSIPWRKEVDAVLETMQHPAC